MKYLFAAGGTGGTLTPGIATIQEIKKRDPEATFLIVGDDSLHARSLCKKYNLAYAVLPEAKIRRYFSLNNFIAPFKLIYAYFKAGQLLNRFKPDVVFGAGGYSEVPIVLSAYTKKIPIHIHQQDIEPVRSNSICKWFASSISVAFEKSVKTMAASKGFVRQMPTDITVIGNPSLDGITQSTSNFEALQHYGLNSEKPVILFFGGSSGSEWLNETVSNALKLLLKEFQVLHITGFGKSNSYKAKGYCQIEFEDDMSTAYTASDIVVARGGLGTLTDLSKYTKPAVIIPLPNSPQVSNAQFAEENFAVITIQQTECDPESLSYGILKLWQNREMISKLKTNIKNLLGMNSSALLADILISLVNNYGKKS